MQKVSESRPAAQSDRAIRSSRFLLLVVFLAGIGTLGIEMVASRLLAPYFGTSQPIWAVVIGLTLIYLSIGYRLGGQLADKNPDESVLYKVLIWGGFLAGFIPILSNPILRFSQGTISNIAIGSFLGALFGVLILFAAPVILLAMVSPMALRLQLRHANGIEQAGSTSGMISAISTVGSILGNFITVLWMIPTFGSSNTTYIMAIFLVAIGLIGLRDWRFVPTIVIVILLAVYSNATRTEIKSADCYQCTLIAEQESLYNYIQIAESENPYYGQQINLILNEGQAIHSIYHPRYEVSGDTRDLLTGGGPWDYFAVTPFVYPDRDPSSVKSMAMLGSATGTVPMQFLEIYGKDTHIDSVEIDPAIIDMGRKYFAMKDNQVSNEHPNFYVHAEDARYWLSTSEHQYDVIGMDAYHQPYIPFHLTTVEFFQEVKEHLTPTGVAVVNAGKGPNGDDRIGQALSATMRAVFPQVFIIDTAGFGNQILIGVKEPVGDGVANFEKNLSKIDQPFLNTVMQWSLKAGIEPMREYDGSNSAYKPFTDDHAPVEQLIDALIFDQIQ
jgi:predicted membrane-bound spermidine synthase